MSLDPKRGDVVTVSLPGDYGKPRPAVVVQSDAIADFDSVIVCPITSKDIEASTVRLVLNPSPENGLDARSQVMVEKVITTSRRRLARTVGRLSDAEMATLDIKLAFVLGLTE